MSDPTVRTDLRKSMFDPKCAHFERKFWPTRSGCSQNQAEKCLTEMAKMGDLGSESSRRSPTS